MMTNRPTKTKQDCIKWQNHIMYGRSGERFNVEVHTYDTWMKMRAKIERFEYDTSLPPECSDEFKEEWHKYTFINEGILRNYRLVLSIIYSQLSKTDKSKVDVGYKQAVAMKN